jgi:toxin ParE1/3/4
MNEKVSFHELAEFELNDAAAFLENEKEGLGVRFLIAVEAAVAQLQKHPQASPIIEQDVRSKPVRRFPYTIMFSIKPGQIRILALANQKRRPFYWRGRG